MKHALFALIAVFFIILTVPAHAVERTWPPKEVDTWIMSYDEIMQLTPEHRQAYLKELRKIIVDFEKNSEAGLPRREAMNLRQLIDDLILPSAYAAGKCLPGEEFFAKHCYLHEQRKKLPGYICTENQNRTYDCDRPFNKLPPGIAAKEPAAKGNPAAPAQTREEPASPKARSEVPARQEPSVFPAAPSDSPRTQSGQVIWPTVNRAHKGDKLTVRSGSKERVKTAKTEKTEKPETTEKPAPQAPSKKKASAEKSEAGDSCRPKLVKCQSRDNYRKAFYQKKRACIYSGNVSSYPGDPEKGKCSAIRDFEGKGKKCSSDQVICNPLVFGFASDGHGNLNQPICVPEGNEATSECDRKSPKDNLNKLFDKGFSGLKEAFNSYVSSLKEICDKDEASAQFHCKECNITKQRLFRLQAKFRGNLCEQFAPSQMDEPETEKSTR